MIREWDDIPEFMKCDEVREIYDVLMRRRGQLYIKRLFDIVMSAVLLILFAIPMIIIAVMIKTDSPGKVFFRQERVTAYGKHFRIHKFRTMVENAPSIGTSITVRSDSRITGIGHRLRTTKLDEIPQLFDVLVGDMTFVGTRAEVPKYFKNYTKEMYATLLLPAGITSEASIRYKDEAALLEDAEDVDRVYIEQVLSEKMKINLESLRKFSVRSDLLVMIRTVVAVLK